MAAQTQKECNAQEREFKERLSRALKAAESIKNELSEKKDLELEQKFYEQADKLGEKISRWRK